ncbi:MAG: hypothetical protein M1562_02065 [Candidatus Marsarchaeota archaeon]|jgi:hypothetical protein|nr:hypothetical protein [Candidatus Marsarchaeota archaeon]
MNMLLMKNLSMIIIIINLIAISSYNLMLLLNGKAYLKNGISRIAITSASMIMIEVVTIIVYTRL